MFENLQDRLGSILKNVRGRGRLTESNIKDTMREVRMALLEADVALPVVREFVEQVRGKAVGEGVLTSLTPGQTLIKIVHDELMNLMGGGNQGLDLNVQPPAIILIAGLQGSGKTTSVAKLACWLLEKQNKKVMVVSCDVYRPAAIEQLQTLAAEVQAECFPSCSDQDPVDIARRAQAAAEQGFFDVLIVDTAGRLHVDAVMMEEIRDLHGAIDPVETLFVVDSMTGQDAANAAKAFDAALPLTGVVLTKADGDARGGAALSIRHITGKPIKFLGVGERTTALEPFHPDRMASRILGMGDVLSLIEEVQSKLDHEQAQRLVKKLKQGKGFDLADFREHLLQMSSFGGLTELMDKLPEMNELPNQVKNQVNDKELGKLIAIINAMTPHERQFPVVIKGSRKRRIATGSGTQIQDVNRLLKQFSQMQKTMKKVKGWGMAKMMRVLKGRIPGGMPPGRLPF